MEDHSRGKMEEILRELGHKIDILINEATSSSKEVRSERMKGLEAAHSKYTPLVAFGHSEWLQKISEFGFFGILLITPIIMATLIKFIKCKSLLLKILFTGCFMFLIYSIIDFPAQTPVCLMTFSILLGLTLKYSELGNRRNP